MGSRVERMIREQIVSRGVTDRKVLAAITAWPRESFVPPGMLHAAYEDGPLPIGYGQTISQPYIVALMTELLELTRNDRVLELGTGSAYQTAILSELAGTVYSAELVPEIALAAAKRIAKLGLTNVVFRPGNALEVFQDEAPFDAILAAAAPAEVPDELVEQLGEGGRLVIPVGTRQQELWLLRKEKGMVSQRAVIPVQFVPLISL